MKKPVIGLFGVHEKNPAGPRTISRRPRTYLSLGYSDSVAQNGGIPMIIPFTRDTDVLLDMLKLCDGVVATGGVDADPAFYGEEPHAGLGEVDRELDDMQLFALRYLLENKVPVLGICRGLQMMNIVTGGTLYQDLEEFSGGILGGRMEMHRQKEEPWFPCHKVELVPGSRLAALLGGETAQVNTFHHQAVKVPGKGFTVTAKTVDGIVEALEHENGVWLGVQWHPEQMTGEGGTMNPLFRDLVEKASK